MLVLFWFPPGGLTSPPPPSSHVHQRFLSWNNPCVISQTRPSLDSSNNLQPHVTGGFKHRVKYAVIHLEQYLFGLVRFSHFEISDKDVPSMGYWGLFCLQLTWVTFHPLPVGLSMQGKSLGAKLHVTTLPLLSLWCQKSQRGRSQSPRRWTENPAESIPQRR